MTQESHSQAYTLRKPKLKKNTCIPLFIAALFTIARTWKQPRCPSTDQWIKKLWYIYTMEYYSAIKRNAFETVLMRWMNLEPIIQSEVSQKEKDKYHILTYILEKAMATHSSILAWRIPWTVKPGGLQSMGSPVPSFQIPYICVNIQYLSFSF